ncbi:putative NLP/P60 protein [Magnetofaba australis IT-1]|uniref:Putative NLP/P60 protein n=1 Tax=Magnetofaba australis IT-1 TaxID=1434232 RepID=A0A1Y2KBI5_9PROT|nr:putative NLP/P60 protein [Magnetofaba australis IT-1]
MKGARRLRRALLTLCALTPLAAQAQSATPEQKNQQQLHAARSASEQAQAQVQTLRTALADSRAQESALIKRVAEAQEALAVQQERLLDDPALTLDAERTALEAAQKALDARREEIARQETQLEQAQTAAASQKSLLAPLESAWRKQAAQAQAHLRQTLRTELEKTRSVEARGEAECGPQGIEQCKRDALADAKRVAREQGLAALRKSALQALAGRMTADQIAQQSAAEVTEFDSLDDGFIGASFYFHRIRALVHGRLIGADARQTDTTMDNGGNTESEPLSESALADLNGATPPEDGLGPEPDAPPPSGRPTAAPLKVGQTPHPAPLMDAAAPEPHPTPTPRAITFDATATAPQAQAAPMPASSKALRAALAQAPEVPADIGDPVERGFRLLEQAKQALEDNRLTTPLDDSAQYYIMMARSLYGVNANIRQEAQLLLREIVKRYLTLSRRALNAGKLRKSRHYLNRARQLALQYDIRDPQGALRDEGRRIMNRLKQQH